MGSLLAETHKQLFLWKTSLLLASVGRFIGQGGLRRCQVGLQAALEGYGFYNGLQ